MQKVVLFAVVVVLGAVIGVGLKQASSKDSADTPKALDAASANAQRKLAGAPAPLAALHAQANHLLTGGHPTLKRLVGSVKGHPAVVNVWASWCGPCRQEMPVMQRTALNRGREVAFIGVDLKDNRPAAKRFLKTVPLSYPSVEDPDGRIFESFKVAGVPSTVFYDAAGKQTYIHQGPYLSEKDLQTDIDRYAAAGKPA